MHKRIFDLVVTLPLLILFSPIMLLVAIAIKFDSKGPIFFRQQRIGKHGNSFAMLKFRSMVIDAPNIGPYFTAQNDSRITAIGKFLRKTSLDELPQLINVLKGEMSLIGPRPDVALQQAQYTAAQWQKRHCCALGITGLAQATLRSEASSAQRISLDLQYVDEVSLTLDLKILLLTVKQVLLRGSY